MKSLKGKLLLAAPSLLDPNFVQSVVLIVQHDENGALGLILNRPTQMTLKEAWEQVSEIPCSRSDPLYVGGPCEGVLMVLHSIEDEGQIEVMEGVYFATQSEQIQALLTRPEESRMRFFVGYAGWQAGQLEGEMEGGSWTVAPADAERVFGPDKDLWRRVKREVAMHSILGRVNPRILPSDPSHN